MIKVENIKPVIAKLKDSMQHGDTIMMREGEELAVSLLNYPSMRTCSGYEDEQIFRAGEGDPDSYHPVMLEKIFEVLNAIDTGRIYPREFEDTRFLDNDCPIDLEPMLGRSEGQYRRQLPSKEEIRPPKTHGSRVNRSRRRRGFGH